MSLIAWVGFVAAGAAGAVVRSLVDDAVSARLGRSFPWGTLVINVTGSFVLGLITGLVLFHSFPATLKVIAGTGFCGAYTTFSTFTYETVRLFEDGSLDKAIRYAAGSLLLGTAAAAVGLAAAAG